MPKKIEPGGKGRIPHLIRCAFKAAEEGDEGEALQFYQQAVAEGYHAKEKTYRQLLFRIRESQTRPLDGPAPIEKSRLDLDKTEVTGKEWEINTVSGLASRIQMMGRGNRKSQARLPSDDDSREHSDDDRTDEHI